MKFLDYSLKTILRGILLVGLGIVAVLAVPKGFDILNRLLTAEEQEQLTLADYAVADSETRNAKKRLRELNSKYADLLRKYNSKVTQYVELQADYNALKESHGTTSSTTPNDLTPAAKDCLEELKGEKIEFSTEDYNYKLDVTATRINGQEWRWKSLLEISQKFRLELLRTTELSTGKSKMFAKLFEIDENGVVKKELEIKSFEFVDEGIGAAGFQWFAPSLKLSVYQPIISKNGWYPSAALGVAFSKYVNALNEDVVHLFQPNIGIATNGTAIFSVTPASYNVGRFIPLVDSLWMGLDVGVTTKGNATFGISIGTSL